MPGARRGEDEGSSNIQRREEVGMSLQMDAVMTVRQQKLHVGEGMLQEGQLMRMHMLRNARVWVTER